MRAIDADALIHTHKSEQALIGRDWDVNDLDAAIELAPTIDAIPIRWIQGKIGYMQCKGNPWTAESLEWLLKAWAQENGHGKG